MLYRTTIGAIASVLVVCAPLAGAFAFDDSKYPDFNGQWMRPPGVGNQYDPSKPKDRGQHVPLTPEYQARFEAGLKDQEAGGQGNDPTYVCIPDGMPRAMNVIFPMEIVVTPKTTYMMIEYLTQLRRIYTDGRKWPEEFEPSFMGYSIGNWTDPDASGRYQTLEVETRFLKGPRTFDPSGAPLADDNQTVVKERLFLDKSNPDILHDEITTIDHALTRPYVVMKTFVRGKDPVWVESDCAEGNQHLRIGKESYMLSADGYLMPAKKGQKPPDLKYFK
ncbi:MAG TPA: hypothetical protein VKW08_14585 [Xanthobacteraceae bacterium]|jgi:hypothetical protein|nr:hypothetical protein [Xanthobacteraceae bacterium]